ncbi:hypothetical protein GCM10007147_28230 [Nocardiopsis kunsanensis]|uniref:Uncharacterized protein n=1 Tax=Nocardiopsis kunsanensis TaxID=141693 RepID=A0A918XEN2_9ACTN|nr:hypothetical protein GCM10007147_28230 [Nocardiopsis kunsanensis]
MSDRGTAAAWADLSMDPLPTGLGGVGGPPRFQVGVPRGDWTGNGHLKWGEGHDPTVCVVALRVQRASRAY